MTYPAFKILSSLMDPLLLPMAKDRPFHIEGLSLTHQHWKDSLLRSLGQLKLAAPHIPPERSDSTSQFMIQILTRKKNMYLEWLICQCHRFNRLFRPPVPPLSSPFNRIPRRTEMASLSLSCYVSEVESVNRIKPINAQNQFLPSFGITNRTRG
jgi:hypothetical protein